MLKNVSYFLNLASLFSCLALLINYELAIKIDLNIIFRKDMIHTSMLILKLGLCENKGFYIPLRVALILTSLPNLNAKNVL